MEKENKTENKENISSLKFRVIAIIDLIIILGLIIGIPLYLILMNPEMWHNFSSIKSFEAFMDSHRDKSIPIYLGCQMIQVIVTILPGQVIQIAGSYFYGFFFAMVLSLIGVTAGSTIAFHVARLVGQKPMAMIFGEKKFNRYKELLDTRIAHKVLFLLYLIPGLPKDMIAYAAGVSRMRFSIFLALSMVGRFPAMVASLLMGMFLDERNYIGAGILAVVVGLIVILCIIKRKTILRITDRYYDKLYTQEDKNQEADKAD